MNIDAVAIPAHKSVPPATALSEARRDLLAVFPILHCHAALKDKDYLQQWSRQNQCERRTPALVTQYDATRGIYHQPI
jgi:hypothetical protein